MSGEVKRRLIGATVSWGPVRGGFFRRSLAIGGLDDWRISRDPLLSKQIDRADHRLGMKSPWHHIASSVLARATRLIPWWWAMYDLTTTLRSPLGTRSGV